MSGRFTSEQLKKLAMGTMFLDHLALAVINSRGLNEVSPLLNNIGIAMRLIGRMAFPLYAFLLVEGFMWTRSRKKYLFRMALLALVSEIPFNLVVSNEIGFPYAQNTIFTLMAGLICMELLETLEKKYENERFLRLALSIWAAAGPMMIVSAFGTDYGAGGVLLIILFYYFRHRPAEQTVAGCVGLFLIYGFSLYLLFAWIAIFFISRYNGERGRQMGHLPYLFYPAHLTAVWLAGVMISGI